VSLVEPEHVSQLLHPRFTEMGMQDHSPIAYGLPASPGAAVGQIVLDAETAARWKSDGKTVLLVRETTSPEDVGGMWAAEGVLTTRGVRTSDSASDKNSILLLLQL
jgi:pyruvate,orthophosphate dikinase